MSASIDARRNGIFGSQSGLSMVEIMVALVLFGIGLSLAMRALPDSNVATTRGRNMTKALNLAQEKIEELMSISYSNPDLDDGTHADPANPIEQHFTRTWTVAEDSPMQGMKHVEVTVSYATGSADDRVKLTTFITSRR